MRIRGIGGSDKVGVTGLFILLVISRQLITLCPNYL